MGAYEYRESRIEWLGKIPRHWKVVRIKNKAKVIPSNVDKKSHDNETPARLCNYVDVYYNDFITPDLELMDATANENELVKFQLVVDDVLITKDSEDPHDIAVPALVTASEDKLLCGYHLSMIRKDNPSFSGAYLFWVLKDEAIASQLYREATGVTRWAIASRHIKNSTFSLPPLEEQRAIAAYLDQACTKIDAAIAIKRKQLKKNKVLRASIIQYAVTKGLDTDATLKDTDFSWIGKIPEHWQVKKLKRILAEVDYGISESTKQEGNHAVLKMGNIVNGEIAYTKIEFVESVSEKLLLKQDDLLFNRTNSHDQVAKVALFRGKEEEQITFASYLVRLRPNHTTSPHYLNYCLNTEAFLGIARKMAIPSVQQANLNPTRYGRLEVVVPPLEEQLEIVEYLDTKTRDIQKVDAVLQEQIGVLEKYRKSLIHECVTGKKQVFHG